MSDPRFGNRRDVQDFNPNHDGQTGEFAPGEGAAEGAQAALKALPSLALGPGPEGRGLAKNPLPMTSTVAERQIEVRAEAANLISRLPEGSPEYAWGPGGLAATKYVPINKIVTEQAWVERKSVKKLLGVTPDALPPVHVVVFQGKHILWDGNHRTTAAFLMGRKTIRAEVLDLDAMRRHLAVAAHNRRTLDPLKLDPWPGSPQLADLENFNPNHDDRGEFATGPGSGAGGPHAETNDGGGAARMFATPAQADAYGAATQGWASSLTAKQEGALDAYTSVVGINSTLRGGKQPDASTAVFKMRGTDGLELTEADVISGLDGVFAKPGARTQDTMLVHRAWAQGGSIKTRDVGEEFVDKGFTSTALVKSETDVFTRDPNSGRKMGILVSIRVPRGTSAIYVGVKPKNREWFAGSTELLLNRGTRFRVIATDKDQHGGKAQHVTLGIVRTHRVVSWEASNSAPSAADRKENFVWQDDDVEWVAANFNPSHDDLGRFADGGDVAGARFRSNAGYIAHAKAHLGGHIVVYQAKAQGLGKGYAVMHEPSSNHLIVSSREQAIDMMHGLAQARSYTAAARVADIFPRGQNFNPNHDDAGRFADGPGGGGSSSEPAIGPFSHPGTLGVTNHRGIDKVLLARNANMETAQANLAILNTALDADRLGYANGLSEVSFDTGVGLSVASYVPPNPRPTYISDALWLDPELSSRPAVDQVHSILHELGHRGQLNVDVRTFKAFKAAGLGRHFAAVIKPEFQKNYRAEQRIGETFAESYARFAQGQHQPEELNAFWRQRSRSA